MKYFNDSVVAKRAIASLADQILAMISAGGVTAPADAPKCVNAMSDLLDDLWWDIHDSLESEMNHARRKLDHVGLEYIDEIDLESLEKASKIPGSIESLLALPIRAQNKIDQVAVPEPVFANRVDAISWLSKARRAQIMKTPMDWVGKNFDVWYY